MKKEPTIDDALRKFADEIQETTAERVARLGPEAYAPPEIRNGNGKRRKPEPKEAAKEPREDNSWLKDMAKCLLDARYGELVSLAEGISTTAEPNLGPTDIVAKAIHTWAKNYDDK